MAKRVLFGFHYQDVIDFRANVVRGHWLTKPDREAAGLLSPSKPAISFLLFSLIPRGDTM